MIDEDIAFDKKKQKAVKGYVVRQVQHPANTKNFEKIYPNPDPTDSDAMYLRRPMKFPKKLIADDAEFSNWDMPKNLKTRYSKNNFKRSKRK